jgi:hypothetical protein
MVVAADITKMIEGTIYWWGRNPQEINCGDCHNFAEMVINNLGGETDNLFESFTEQLWDNHCWITFEDVNGIEWHYDAEAPSGVKDYNDLPFFQRKGRQTYVRARH